VVAGVAKGVNSGERLLLERHTRSGWAAVSHGSTRDGGAFRLRYTPHKAGSSLLRVRLAEADAVAPLHATVARAKTFRDALVSWYGPGFYGGPLACGGAPLGYNQLGVANKTLPCGTMVTIRYHGKSVRVPVIDRGPYVGDREFDLTRATKDSIGFDGVGVVKVSVAKS
jgi:rare lipoprotein A (peptidoglycan hydrolase)